jgi:hypothetical protein
MLENISYFLIFGRPLIFYLGILSLTLLVSTAAVGYLNFKGRTKIPFKWHPRLAALTITVVAIHGALGILLYI